MFGDLPISAPVWERLVEANQQGVQSGWAERGVFGTGIGPDYNPGADGSLLYVGKSAGPLGQRVGSCDEQTESIAASTEWMIGRANKSAFWQFVEKLFPTRREIAWTNICKMDRCGGILPPTNSEWSNVAQPCIAALCDEISTLAPQIILFATSRAYQTDVIALLTALEYRPTKLQFDDGWTKWYQTASGRSAFLTRHPQGWSLAQQAPVLNFLQRKLS